MDLIIPFKVGDVVELKSFQAGYRGAWFRCKISDMCVRYGQMECQCEYLDYPEEKRSWSRLYQISPECRNQKAGKASCGNAGNSCVQKTGNTLRKHELRAPGRKKAGRNRELMLRPPFPRWCRENDIPELGQKLDILAVVSSPWKVGDLVDWWYNDCFWTGKIVELLDDDKVKIACPEVPLGEGGSYEADLEDLRPALDWSLINSWSAPLSQENGESWYTARLIAENPDTGISRSDEKIEQSDDGNKEVHTCSNGSFDKTKQEIQECLNGSSFKPEKVMDPAVKHPADTNGRCCTRIQTHSEEEPGKCTSEDPDTSPKAFQSGAQLAPYECHTNSQADSPVANSRQSCQFLTNGQSSLKKLKTSTGHASVQQPLDSDKIDECCTNSQADSPTSPMAHSGQSSQFTNGQSCLTGSKKLKTSTEHASVQSPAPGTVSKALMEVEELARKIRRAQDLLDSIDDEEAPPGRTATPAWKFQ